MLNLKAQNMAVHWHRDQLDKAGKPYVWHLRRVAEKVADLFEDATHVEIEAAWLHDILEDTPARVGDLFLSGFSVETIRIIQELTRPRGRQYLAWIKGLADNGSLSAVRVKYADNLDNSDESRMPGDAGSEMRIRTRYRPARRLLERRLGIAAPAAGPGDG